MNDDIVKIKDMPMVRDLNSKAILSVDKVGLNNYLMRKEIAKQQSEEKKKINDRLDSVEKNLQEITQLLNKLVNSNGN